jgi:hypothetical protein
MSSLTKTKQIKATDKQRDSWRLIGKGIGVHWEALDEDLSVQALLN